MWQHVLSLSIFSSYFLAILGLFALILRTLSTTKGASRSRSKSWLFGALTLGSLAHTWLYMFKYMEWSFRNYENSLTSPASQDLIYRVATWLYDTSLFEEAWSYVVFHPLNWWWSEQLCLFTVGAWTVFVAIEGTRYKVKHLWAYMLLGQIVAISVASNLFYLALILSPKPPASNKGSVAGPKLYLSVLASLASVAVTPFTSQSTFLPNLLIMHALLFIPLVSPTPPSARFSISVAALYRLIHIAAVAIRLRTVVNAVAFLKYANHSGSREPAAAAWFILNSHPAQSSIGWDIVWTSLSFIAWKLIATEKPTGSNKLFSPVYLLFATPLASIGVTAPYALLPQKAAPSTEKDVKAD